MRQESWKLPVVGHIPRSRRLRRNQAGLRIQARLAFLVQAFDAVAF